MLKKIWSYLKALLKNIWNYLTGNNKLPPAIIQPPVADTFLYTTQTENDGQLQVFEGELPNDMNGVFYVMYPVGTVNSKGLPFPEFDSNGKYNKEYGTPIMNGDGMLLSVNFNGTQYPDIKTRLMKTPCYFADYNSRNGTKDYETLGFSNFGISRMSLLLGARNEPNTAVTPVKFGNANTFLLASYDVGRPFITDPVNLVLQTPVGQNTDWVPGTPGFLPWPFPIVQTTAHPSFDPNTEEVFTVNYTRMSKAKSFISTPQSIFYLQKNPEKYKTKLLSLCKEMEDEQDSDKIQDRLKDFFENLDHFVGGKEKNKVVDETKKQTSVWLMRWKGTDLIEKWVLTDQLGQALQIAECMHQTALTKDYIVLTDTAFKFSIDL
ncbi:MAG TPA: carotenoid oxygenase family protein, partial [Ferruginibacter sp.]|nr:carotenoid oxygenase family protein [Ferruginibacter sp.]